MTRPLFTIVGERWPPITTGKRIPFGRLRHGSGRGLVLVRRNAATTDYGRMRPHSMHASSCWLRDVKLPAQTGAGTAKSMTGPSGTTPVGLMLVWLS